MIESSLLKEEGAVTANDFERMFGFPAAQFPAVFHERLKEMNTRWRTPSLAEIESYLLDILKRIHAPFGPRSPAENLEAFEKGWRQNLERAISQGLRLDTLKPGYFRPTKYLRYNQSLIVAENLDLEHDLFLLSRILIFSRYLAGHPAVYEFGCGSCANLLLLSELNPGQKLFGADWAQASVDIAKLIGEKTKRPIQGALFDMLDPSSDFPLPRDAAVVTIHALEQLGERHTAWLEFLVRKKPALVVNYEPIMEMYDENNAWDYLALLYSRKRGYLSGYWPALQRLAQAGRVEILTARRPKLGGVYHEASLLVWKPC